jgi:hypothetical protein
MFCCNHIRKSSERRPNLLLGHPHFVGQNLQRHPPPTLAFDVDAILAAGAVWIASIPDMRKHDCGGGSVLLDLLGHHLEERWPDGAHRMAESCCRADLLDWL